MTEKELKTYWTTLNELKGNIPTISTERDTLLSTIKYPNSLFRFRSVSEGSLSALQNNTLSFSTPSFYDDPFDTYLRVDLNRFKKDLNNAKNDPQIKEVFIKLLSEANITNVNLDDYQYALPSFNKSVKLLRNALQNTVYSICFCENVENENLWLKYAENHRGFVLEYQISEEVKQYLWNCGLFANLLPIYYSDKKYDAIRYASYNIALFATKNIPEINNQLQGEPICWENTKLSVIKKKCHKYDKEWRIVPLYTLQQRESILWQPRSVTIGLRTPKYKERLIISAAQVAGITQFYKMVIDEHDNFVRKPLSV